MDFSTLTLDKVIALMDEHQEEWHLTNLKLYDGDHWLDGDGWVGPRPDPLSAGAQTIIQEIERAFVSQNVVREVVDRQSAGVAGREPAWKYVPKDGDPAKITQEQSAGASELGNFVTEWWDSRDALLVIEKVVRNALLVGRGVLRVYIPPAERSENGSVPQETFEASLDKIYIHSISPDQGLVYTDPETMQKVSIYLYKEGDDTYAEISYYDRRTKDTVWQVLGKEGIQVKDGVIQQTRLQLDGRLMLGQITLDAIITTSVRQNQFQVNKGRTMMGRNTDLGGFLERTVINGKMPGDYFMNADGTETFIEGPMKVGPGTINYIVGEEVVDAEGKKQVLTPSIIYRDPVNPDTFVRTIQESYVGILREVRQLHAVITADSTIGADSRRQALADYVNLLIKSKQAVDALGRWMLSIVTSLAAQFSKTAATYEQYRVDFAAQLYSGPVSAEELKIILEMVAAEFLSVESGRVRAGIEDPDAEKALVEAEKAAKKTQVRTAGAAILENFDDGAEDEEDVDPDEEDVDAE